MHLSISRNSDRTAVPWGNNYGQTANLYTNPQAVAGDQGALRIGIASIEVDGCQFSIFKHALRTQVILSGASELNIDQQPHRLPGRGAQLTFSGESTTVCRILERPLAVINFIYGSNIAPPVISSVAANQLHESYPSLQSANSGSSWVECLLAIDGLVKMALGHEIVSLGPLDAVVIERQNPALDLPFRVSGSGEIVFARIGIGRS